MSNNDLILAQGNPQRELPGAQVNGVPLINRQSRYGELYAQIMGGGGYQANADEGSYFVTTNPTFGTPIVGTTAPTSFSATVALMTWFNAVAPGSAGAKRIYPLWVALEVSAVGTSGTAFQYVINADTGNRFSSGGTALTPANPNMDSSAASISTINFGALTATAASGNVRRIKHGQARASLKVSGDIYLFLFGQPIATPPGADIGGTNVQIIPVLCPPVVLGPNQTLLLHEVAPSQAAAASYGVSAGWLER